MNNITSYNFVEVLVERDVEYIQPFSWEAINLTQNRKWMEDNWTISLYASAIYVILIFSVQKFMENREAFQLRKCLVAWNILLSLFSIVGFFRTIPELIYVTDTFGYHYSVCVRNHHNAATAFWGWLMTWSKIAELGDTAFIVLRKQPLIFLHWYHHISVLVYTFFVYIPYDPPLRYFMVINFIVHGIMYAYYALKAMRVRVPRNWAMMITALQLSQMVVGVTINVYSLWVKSVLKIPCDRDFDSVYVALIMYASYLLLFVNFFYRAYFSKKTKKID